MKKIIMSLIIISASFTIGTQIYSAEDMVAYDLTAHQPIEVFTIEEDGETVVITITDDSLTHYNLLARIADKTYTISKNKQNSWAISYKVSIKNNKITSAYGGQFTASQGSFSNTSVSKLSDYTAIGKGTWKHRAFATNLQIEASIKNSNLVVE